MDRQEWLTVEQVAEQLQAHPDTVRRWLREKRLKGHLISRRAGYRIRPDDVRAFAAGEVASMRFTRDVLTSDADGQIVRVRIIDTDLPTVLHRAAEWFRDDASTASHILHVTIAETNDIWMLESVLQFPPGEDTTDDA